MNVLMTDAIGLLSPDDLNRFHEGALAELLYADDTLLLGVSADALERFLAAVNTAGGMYGLELHWGKLQLMQVHCEGTIHRPNGTEIDPQLQMTYLGTTVSDDGRSHCELAKGWAWRTGNSAICQSSGNIPP